MSGRWDTYLGHDRPLPMGEQSHREYHSGDPEPEAYCADCGCALYEGDYYTHSDEETTTCWECTDHPGEAAGEEPHDLRRCTCDACDETRAEERADGTATWARAR